MRSALLTEENRGLCKFNTPSQERNFDSSVAYHSSSCSIHNRKSSHTQDEDMLEIPNKDEDMLEISEELYSINKESFVTVISSITAN